MIKSHQLYDCLNSKLIKNNFFKFKKNISIEKLFKKNYGLIINCDLDSSLSKNFFYSKIEKNTKVMPT